MKQSNRILLITALFAGILLPRIGAAGEQFQNLVRPFLNKHCVRCHRENPKSNKGQRDKGQRGKGQDDSGPAGDLRLDTQVDFSAKQLDIWIEVMDKLNLGEMPPPNEPQPSEASRRDVVRWIAQRRRELIRNSVGGSGRALSRRINRVEFSNTIRDLLDMEFLPGDDPARRLPPDATFEGFDKVGAALMLDSSLLDGYYMAAKEVADRALVVGPPKYPTHTSHYELEDMRKDGSGFTYMCGTSGTVCGDHDVRLLLGTTRTARGLLYPGTDQLIPVKGVYTIRVRASSDRGDRGQPVKMFVERQNGREGRLMEVEVTASRATPDVYSVTLPLDALHEARGVYMKVGIVSDTKLHVGMMPYNHFEKAVKHAATAADLAQSLRLQARMKSEGWVGRNRPAEVLLDPSSLPKLFVDWIEIEGPIYRQWPPSSHRTVLFKGDESPQTLEYAREIFARLLPRAFRRPVDTEEVDRVVDLVEREFDRGTSFLDAIRLGIVYTLTSPSFLYITRADNAEPQTTGSLANYELASRLSYFLWCSMPDDRLFELARDGQLADPAILAGQVDRMLKDTKAEALVSRFAAQWLKTAEFLEFTPDRKIYRDFDPTLREDMAKETLAFFAEILRNDLSALNFLDSDFVVVNQRLAQFYGLRGVHGEQFRRINLPVDSPRGGLLGQAGVHLRGSDGVRTKPVNRGVYVREVLFNDPPDPPPPNVGEVEPNIQGERLTVRDRLLQHQQIDACASCHRGIDPYGLALENFDVTGAWRTHQNGEDFRGAKTPSIDASGVLPNGETFRDFGEFKRLLMEDQQQDRFRRGLVEKLFLYALGRPAGVMDRDSIDETVNQMKANGDTLSAAMKGLVLTNTFRGR